MSKLMNDNFVIVHLDVQESADKKDLENEGGMDFARQWGGDKSGLPFMVVLDKTGKKLIDSNREKTPQTNIGYPAKPEEIAWFLNMVSHSGLNKSQIAQMKGWLTEHAPK